ncbi:MAG: J domain-containing protein [Pirellulales bacterium]|nr:J domain-containing protein [Pirellulales bacterium]
MADDYYKILGVRRDASAAEIQDAYRNLARKHHPDVNPDDKDASRKFQQIQAAFDVLSDQKKREMYDRYGASFESAGAGPRGGGPWSAGPGGGYGGFQGEGFDFSQFFDERYGSESSGGGGFAEFLNQFRSSTGSRRGRSRRGTDLEHELTIPFVTAVTGGKTQIALTRRGGKTETITVNIPPGIEDGKKIRLRGQGEPGAGSGKPGDLLLRIRVTPHEHFERRGKNLYLKAPITLAEAALGAKIDVPTPKGAVSVRVPPATSSGTKLRLKGHGVAARDGSAGDLLVEVQIVLPRQFDDESRQMLEKIAAAQPQPNPRAKLRW